MTDATKPVVVGVDGTPAATAAARWAAAMAYAIGRPLQIVHAMPDPDHLFSDAAAAARAAVTAYHRESAAVIVQSVEEAVRADFGTLAITTTQSGEPAAKVLVGLSRDACMVVLGAEEISPFGALLVGSTTVDVATHSECPVVAWRGESTTTDTPITLGVDGDRTGVEAIESAFELADRLGVAIKAVNAWPAPRFPTGLPIRDPIDWDGLETRRREGVVATISPWAARYPNVKVTCFIERCGASEALLRHAADSQLVVVGSRGRGLVVGALLGSTNLNLLHHCRIPVMLCHSQSNAEVSTG